MPLKNQLSGWINFTSKKGAKPFHGKVVVFKTDIPYYGTDNDAASSPTGQKNLWSLAADPKSKGSEFVGFINLYDQQNKLLASPVLEVLLQKDSLHSQRLLSADAFAKVAKGNKDAFLHLRAAAADEISRARDAVNQGKAIIVYSSPRFKRVLDLG